MTALPVIELDGENDHGILASAKSLGYFHIHRSSSYGHIPDQTSLKFLVEKLFNLSLENKLAVGPEYIRSTSLNESPLKKESFSLTPASEMMNIPQFIPMKTLFNICQQISIYLVDLLELTKDPSSSSPDIILLNHYSQINGSLIINKSDNFVLQFHLFSTCYLQELHSYEHEWKSFNNSPDFDDYILVTLPNFLYRYSIDESSSHYTIDYLCNSTDNEQSEQHSYPLNLKQNTLLRYFTFFYLYLMQGVPAGFSSTALANYLTAEGKQSSTVGTFVSISNLPWALKFIWGPLIDRFQSSTMGRRRPWVIATQICAFLASLNLLFVGTPPIEYIKTLLISFFIHAIFASGQDASVDAQAITITPLNERGRVNGFMRGGFLIGSAVGAAGLSWIIRNRGYFTAAVINSIFLFTFTIITFFIKEKPDDKLLSCSCRKSNIKNRKNPTQHNYTIKELFIELFKGLLSGPSLRLFIPILVVSLSQAAFRRAYSIHLINVLGWSDTSVSILEGVWGPLIIISIALIGGWLADYLGARRLLIAVIFVHASYMLTANLIESYWSKRPVAIAVLILRNMMDPILSTASIPVVMSLCRPHIEGSQFTAYMSLINLSELLGAFISGHLQQYFRANIIGLGCAVLIIGALLTVSFSLWREHRHNTVVAVIRENIQPMDPIVLKKCQPIQVVEEYHGHSLDSLSPNNGNLHSDGVRREEL